jgi:xanthine dehydrogenase iron-sulfur cluster and FAD-binding subunit A
MEASLKTKNRNCHIVQQYHSQGYLKDCDSGSYSGTCTPTFIATLCTMAKLWKQPRSHITNEWIKKMYLFMMEI